MKEFWNEYFDKRVRIGLLIILGVSAIAIILISPHLKHAEEFHQVKGYVLAKDYNASKSDLGIGLGMSTSGNAVIAFSDNSSPESFSIIINLTSGVEARLDSKNFYGKVQEGDSVELLYKAETINGRVQSYEVLDIRLVN